MAVAKISNRVYSVGVMNPSLRVFDIVMEARYGTSYNAYLIDDRKTALVETVHSDYFEEYIYNVGQLADVGDIDYLIMNHTELDHSGSIKKLLEINPNITIVCTAAAKKYLSAILNSEFKCQVVKDGDQLCLGRSTIKFVVAPMLHWPDSMMTYLPEDNVLFSCDFLGCHFCEPEVTDDKIHYYDKYLQEFKYYYQGIFSPFKDYVLNGLDKIKDFQLDIVAPSHGPVLVEGIEDRMDDYRRWSQPVTGQAKSIAVLYASAYGCTKELAQQAMTAINEAGVEAALVDMVTGGVDNAAAAIAMADGVMIGTCTINRDAPSIVWNTLAMVDAVNVKGKPAVVFGSYGWSGEAPDMAAQRLQQLKFDVMSKPIKVNFVPNDNDKINIQQAAKDMVAIIKQNS